MCLDLRIHIFICDGKIKVLRNIFIFFFAMDATFKAMGLGIEDFLLLFNAFKALHL